MGNSTQALSGRAALGLAKCAGSECRVRRDAGRSTLGIELSPAALFGCVEAMGIGGYRVEICVIRLR